MQNRVHLIENFLNPNEFEELLGKINSYNTDYSYPGWKHIGHSSSDFFDKKFWYIDLQNDPYFTNSLFTKIKSTIKYHFDENVKLDLDIEDSVYLNGTTFGQQGYYHKDLCDRTLLVYCNKDWKIEHSGATVFTVKSNDDEKHLTIYPKNFSAVYFDSNIQHFSQSVSKDFLGLRVTLAYKLFLTDE